ncbi:MAG: hypothetical protein AAF721_05295 [Myxococcota bacterium]
MDGARFWIAGAALAAACIRPGAYPCARDSQCDAAPSGVFVQPEGYCSYVDDECDSGLRFESRAPGGLAGTCVEPETNAGTTGEVPPPGSSTSDGDPDSESEAESTAGPPACGGAHEPCCDNATCEEGTECFGQACSCLLWAIVGDFHSCVVRIDRRLECWGGNVSQELGRDDLGQFSPTPGPVVGLPQPLFFESAQARRHTCVVALGGATYCWGDNAFGQVNPDAPATAVGTATDVGATLGLGFATERVGVGSAHTCVAGEGHMFCWGNNDGGQLGWSVGDEPEEVDLSALPGPVTEIAAGLLHTCVRTGFEDEPNADTHAVYCWGYDELGYLGTGPTDTTSLAPVPTLLDDNLAFRSINASDTHTCVVAFEPDTPDDRVVLCWGDDTRGGVTGAAGGLEPTPIPVPGLVPGRWEEVFAGDGRTCATNENDEVWCWGNNELGISDPDSSAQIVPPTVVDTLGSLDTFVFNVGVGLAHSCGVATDGTVACWGCGALGQLGESSPFCDENGGQWAAVRSQCE